MPYDEMLAARVRTMLADRRDVEEKHMFGGVGFMVRGHMTCGIVGSSLMVRLDPDEAEVLLQEPGARPMDFTGRPMRGFLFVDPKAIARAPSLRKWVARATAHADALPVKAKKRLAAKPTRSRSRRS